MQTEIIDLLKQLGPGRMSATAYDTAWVARLGDVDRELSNNALNWICENQLPDGSWGAELPYYYHDRVISTLSAMIALTYRGRRSQDHARIEKGLFALERIAEGATQGLQGDPNGATVGFEMIVPTLVAEAENLGIIKRQGERILGRLSNFRKLKLQKMMGYKINRHVTMAFSAEMAGADGQDMLEAERLQESNGSVGHSPSASAFFVCQVKHGDPGAIRYLREAVNKDGGAPNLFPFEVYEKAWALWNLTLCSEWEQQVLDAFEPHLAHLKSAWKPGKGVGFSAGYSIPDGDDTIITHDVLRRFNRRPDLDAILSFEEADHFRCYDLEVGLSPSVNIHALMALQRAGYDVKHPTIRKILNFLESSKFVKSYWIDKWHSSPYYTAAHYIIACNGLRNESSQSSVNWLLETQRQDGSWGFFMPTAEETAYCLQALVRWKFMRGDMVDLAVRRGSAWLKEHSEPPYPPLWIGKGLYSADLVVRSAILSALALTEKI